MKKHPMKKKTTTRTTPFGTAKRMAVTTKMNSVSSYRSSSQRRP